jgi:hypothetical protein
MWRLTGEGRLGIMRKALWRALLAAVLLWGGTLDAHGQQATEIYIPVGQSPGLSGKVTIIGTIETVNPQARTIAGSGPAGAWSTEVTDRTKVWLDKSKLRQTNKTGSFADLRTGQRVEVKWLDSQRRGSGPADWIKVEYTEPGPR